MHATKFIHKDGMGPQTPAPIGAYRPQGIPHYYSRALPVLLY